MVCHHPQLYAIVHYTSSTLCVVGSGLITPRGRHSGAKNWFLENRSKADYLSLL